jgi:hypothetical protein
VWAWDSGGGREGGGAGEGGGRGTEDAREGGAEFFGVEGFEVAGGEAVVLLLRGCEALAARGEEHEGGTGQRGIGADGGGEFEAVFTGHVMIEDDEIEGLAGGDGAVQGVAGGGGGVGGGVGELPRGAEVDEEFSVGGVVVDDEGAVAGKIGGGVGRARGGGRSGIELRGKPECRTAAGGADKADGAAHELGEAFADHETETGAAEAAGGRGVGLDEGLEESGLDGARDADAGIGDGEVKERRTESGALRASAEPRAAS